MLTLQIATHYPEPEFGVIVEHPTSINRLIERVGVESGAISCCTEIKIKPQNGDK